VTTATVRFLDGEPNGLAAMLGALIEGNLTAHPDRERLLAKPAVYVISAPDVDVAVSIRLAPGSVSLRNGTVKRWDITVIADSETLMALSSVPLRLGLPDTLTKEGREVAAKLLTGRLRVKGLVVHPRKLARLNKLLSVS
jgi:hypothetical protein